MIRQRGGRLVWWWLRAAMLSAALAAACAPGYAEEGGASYSAVDRLNAGLSDVDDPPDLETPRASLENFLESCAVGDFGRAARSLNLNAVAPVLQPEVGATRARQLKELIDQQIWFNWVDVPDRADGADDGAGALRGGGAEHGGPRPSLKLGSLPVGDREVDIRLERVKPARMPPVWVFSRQTVGHVPGVYAHYRSGTLEAAVPSALKAWKFGPVALWQWVGFAVTLTAGGLLGWLVQKVLNAVLRWTRSDWARTAAEAIRGPGALTIGLAIAHHLARTFLGLAGPVLSVLEPVYAVVLVAGAVWFLLRLISTVAAQVCRRYEALGDDADANAVLTRITVTRHILAFLSVVLGAGYALSRFAWFREMGMTLLASAGVAGLILGVAAQRMLGNLFAGFVLALTQPVKTGDAILFEGQFGWIEEIAITYLVIRSWDLRRVVVPITYFLDRPFQNWSRRSRQLMMPVFVRADYRIDVEVVRAEFKSIMESSVDWDRQVPPILQVTDCHEETVELRALCSAGNPTSSWNLQCFVRERLVAFIRDYEGGRYLPRKRFAMVSDPAPSVNGSGPHPDAPPPTGGEGLPKGPPAAAPAAN